MKKPVWIQKLEYRYEKLINKGILSRILMLFVATLLVILLGTLVMYLLDPGSNVSVNAWNNATTAINAWMPEIEETEEIADTAQGPVTEDIDWGYYIVTALVAIGGLLITSTLIGIISSGIEEKLDNVRKGENKLFETGHIVLLGFAPGSTRILEEIAEYTGDRKQVVVIAEAQDSLELEETIRDFIDLPKNIKIITRNIDITDTAALQCCSIPTASMVLIHPDDDGTALKAVLAVSMMLKDYPDSGVRIVAGVYKRRRMLPSGSIDSRILMLRIRDTVSRLMARCSIYPGLSKVLTDLFDFKGCELYVRNEPDLAGKTFLEVMENMDEAVPIGIIRDDQKLLIPKPRMILRERDRLIRYAENADSFSMLDRTDLSELELDPVRNRFDPKKKVVIIGMNSSLEIILQELPEDIHRVAFASAQAEEIEAADRIAEENNTTVEFCKTDLFDDENLLNFIDGAGHVILLASDYAAGGDPDADNLALLLKLRSLRQEKDLEFSITVEFLDDICRKMAECDDDTDFIVASSMASLVLSQAALNPDAVEFLREFTMQDGKVLTLKSCEAFGCTGKPRTVRELRKIVYLQNHVMLGIVINKNGRVETIINPPLDKVVELTEKDSLIVVG